MAWDKKKLKNHKGYSGKKHSEKTRKKISASLKGNNNPNFGKKISREQKEKISKANIGNQYAKGYKHSEEGKKKMRKPKKNTEKMGRYERTKEMREKLSLARKGEKSQNWKGGITMKNALIRCSGKYRSWKKAVLQRDNYTCQKCQSKEKLHVDHIKQFVRYPLLRFNISNGRTLCEKCHRKTKTWGKNG